MSMARCSSSTLIPSTPAAFSPADTGTPTRLVATPALASGLLPPALAQLPPGLQPQQLQIQSLSAQEAVQAVLAKTVDLGVVSLPLEHRGLELHWIGEAACVAVLAADSPLAAEPVLSMQKIGRAHV